MIFKNSFDVTLKNVNLVIKVLLYVFILLLICMALFFAIVEPILNDFFYEFDISAHLNSRIKQWLDGESGSFRAFLSEIGNFFSSRTKELTTTVVLFALLYTMLMYFVNLTAIPITKVLYDNLREGLNQKFLHAFISSLAVSLLYSLICTLITVAIDFSIIIISILLVSVMTSAFNYIGITLTIAIALALFACRICLFGQWLPQIVCEKKSVFVALKDAFKLLKKSFLKVYIPILVTVIFMFIFIMSTAIFTFFISLILALPVYLVMLNTINLIVYFSNSQTKYQIDTGLN